MKGIFNKFKGFIGSDTQSSPPKKTHGKHSEVPSEEGVSEDTQQKSTKRPFFPVKKIVPKTRHQIVKDYLYSAKFYKLLQALEKEGEKDGEVKTYSNVYFKENFKPMTAILKENVINIENVDLASQDLSNLYNSYQNGSAKDDTPLFCISVINSNPQSSKDEPTIEYLYPSFKDNLTLDDELTEFLEKSLKNLGVPEAANNEDFVYFIIDINRRRFEKLETEALLKVSKDISHDHALLYGISYFKQIPASQQEAGNVQKAVCILSRVPLFGHLLAKLDPVTKCYLLQENHEDTQILKNFYDNINSSLKEITINLNELLAGTCTKKLVYFLKAKLMTLWKALFLEKRILVFSQHPSACSTFIHSLMALYPCLCHFKYHSKALSSIENHYSEYGLPLRFFHEDCPVIPYLKANSVESIESARGFLAGTSKNLTNVNWDILVDIDKNSIQFKNDAVKKALTLTKQDKEFIQNIIKKVISNNSPESLSWSNIESSIFNDVDIGLKGSEDWIRLKFYNYLKNFLIELEFFASNASAEKLDIYIEDYNAYLNNKGQTDETFDWKDEILSPEDEMKGKKDGGDETEDEEIGSPSSVRSKSSKGKRNPRALSMSQDDLDDFVQRTNQIDFEEKKVVEEKENKKWFRSPSKRDSKPPEMKSPQDAKTILRKELMPLKDSMKTLKKYGIDWMLSWAKSSNFECWLDTHMKAIGERSKQNRLAKNHFWCLENGDIYFGELRFGYKTGTGQFLDRQAKVVYSGDWEEDERTGTGKLVSIETGETIYEGNFNENRKQGVGKWTRNNEKYTGAFNMDKYEGSGTLVDKDQNVYEGEFKEGYKWGIGKLQLANGDLYTGEFMKDKYHGKGQLVCKNGDFYSGEFEDGIKCGHGVFQTAAGETYEGQFKNNVYEGSGKLTRKDGYAFEGIFRGGKLANDEQGFIHYPDGSEYMGTISDYKAHGYGTLTKHTQDNEFVCYGVFDSDQLIEEVSKVSVEKKDQSSQDKPEEVEELDR